MNFAETVYKNGYNFDFHSYCFLRLIKHAEEHQQRKIAVKQARFLLSQCRFTKSQLNQILDDLEIEGAIKIDRRRAEIKLGGQA